MKAGDLAQALWVNRYYFVSMVLFLVGLHTMLANPNLIKKIMGLNIMETGVFLFFISVGYVSGGRIPIMNVNQAREPAGQFINPLPSALILTGIVIAVSLTAFALSLVIRMYEFYGTLNADEIARIRLTGKAGGS